MCLFDFQPDDIQLLQHNTSYDNLKSDQAFRVVIYSTQHGKIQRKLKTSLQWLNQARQRRFEANQTIVFIWLVLRKTWCVTVGYCLYKHTIVFHLQSRKHLNKSAEVWRHERMWSHHCPLLHWYDSFWQREIQNATGHYLIQHLEEK